MNLHFLLASRAVVTNCLARTMSSSKYSYESAVWKLNCLQSNKSTLEEIQRNREDSKRCPNIQQMKSYLLRTGVTLDQLDELSVIHVAGTKGKGSTSAMCESILRHHGYHTGFYSSPHLTAVRERVRLDGRVLSRGEFAAHFHRVHDMLYDSQSFEGDMPKYFAFLTVLAFNVFLREGVDVAVVEVGIGGVLDYTNVLRKVPIVGITALGLDHTEILGSTLPEIARAKAGIMKPGCVAFTVEQKPEAMEVLRSVARDVQCPLKVVPPYASYNLPAASILQADLPAYQTNASLAIQLAHGWLAHAGPNVIARNLKKEMSVGKISRSSEIDTIISKTESCGLEGDLDVPVETILGLKECNWPGRYQRIETEYAMFFLDGAHTAESMLICCKWFEDNARSQDKILIFSSTGNRDAEVLLKPLTKFDFKAVFFVIPTAYKDLNKKNDNYLIKEQSKLICRCNNNCEIWKATSTSLNDIYVMESVSEALINIKRSYNNIEKSSVLITGSLHLVGAALSIIDPNLSSD